MNGAGKSRRAVILGACLPAAATVVGMGACALGQADAPAPTSLPAAQLELWKGLHATIDVEEGLARPVLDAFTAARPSVRVTLSLMTFQDWNAKAATAFAAGTPPDVAYIAGAIAFARNQYLLALDPLLARGSGPALKRDMDPQLWDVASLDGKTYGIPWLNNCSLLLYNKQLFERAGLDPARPPSTWEQLLDAARRSTSQSEGRWGYGTPFAEWIENLYWVQQAGGEWFTPDLKKCTLNSPAAVAGIEFLVDMVRRHQVATYEGHTAAFQTDKVAMLTHRPPQVTAVLRVRPDFPLGLAPRPKGPAPEPKGRAAYRGVGSACIAAASKARDQSWALVEHLLTPESLRQWIKGLGQLSPRNSVSFYAADPVFKTFEDNLRFAYPPPLEKAADGIAPILMESMARALRGDAAVKPILDDTTRQIDALLAR